MSGDPRIFSVVIIGAGFSGIGLAIELTKGGVEDFIILERGEGIGGCWLSNTYPGVACDVPSHLYSFSYEPNPRWSRSYSEGAEIRRYLQECADKYGVTPRVRFNERVTAIRREGDLWAVEIAGRPPVWARAVVPALGPLSHPMWPDIQGLSRFSGALFHSGEWDHSVSLDGKRVGVIGSASSAAQIVPAIVGDAAHLGVFMRTPNWVVPRSDHRYSDLQQRVLTRFPAVAKLLHQGLFWRWEMNYSHMLQGSRLSGLLSRYALRHMRNQVRDPKLRQVLIPDFAYGCKRTVVSNSFLRTLQSPKVSLVTEPIDHVDTTGIRTADGSHHAYDVLVLATGYRSFDVSACIDVTGPGGVKLADLWAERAVTYRTVAVPGLPNFFMMMGPSTGLGHNTVTAMIETQARYIRKCLQFIHSGTVNTLTPKAAPAQQFYADTQIAIGKTVLNAGCNAWYQNGKSGAVESIWPDSVISYRRLLARPAFADFDVA